MNLYDFIRTVPDFPKPGILFRDITPLLGDQRAFKQAVDKMLDLTAETPIDRIAAIESRGFLFGAPMAAALGVGIAIIRKKGKLPYKTVAKSYELEYGENTLEIHADALQKDERILVVDDVLATGGTAHSAGELIRMLGGVVAGYSFLIELNALRGRQRFDLTPVHRLLEY